MGDPNPGRGGIVLQLIAAAAILCVIAVAGMAIFAARSIRVVTHDRGGNSAEVSIDTPAGHLSVHAHDNSEAGVPGIPVYPGAKPRKDSGGNASIQWTSERGDDRGFALSAASLVTSDSVDQVSEYYRKQFPNWTVTHKDGEVHLELQKGGYHRIISIEEENDGTHIGVATVGEPASN
jgi:hypothetical protein